MGEQSRNDWSLRKTFHWHSINDFYDRQNIGK